MKKKLYMCILVIALLLMVNQFGSVEACGRRHRKQLITIIRDDYGVPHVYAKTKEGLGFGCGYAMAQDRLWQAEIYRRSAFGNLAEIGFATIEQDLQTRKIGYSREELLEIFNSWTPSKPKAKLKEMLLAFVDGVNKYIEEAIEAYNQGDLSKIPAEYLYFGFFPEPWTIEDSVAIMSMMAWRFGGTGGAELSYLDALQRLEEHYAPYTNIGWDIFNDLYPQNDPGAEVSIRGECCGNKLIDYSFSDCGVIEISTEFLEIYKKTQQEQIELLQSLGVPTSFGSNAWIVHPGRSESRNALQVGGPQMGHSIPQIVMEVGLHGAGINAVGMMMPMVPSILIGVSTNGAWTSTTGSSDVMDTYIEVINPTNDSEYWYNGEWKAMDVRTERIYLGKNYYEDHEIKRTIHGPIIDEWEEESLAFTMKTPYYFNDLEAEEGWSLFQQAKNHKEFLEACATVQPSHNFLWADKHGNIAYVHAGRFPIKPEEGREGRIIDDRLPLWGTGEEEWLGLTGFEVNPKCVNPKEGFIANWNNKPIADWSFAESDAGWGEGHRVKRIQDLLSMKDKYSFEDMNEINKDAGYNHIPAMNLLDDLIAAAETSVDPDIQAVLPYLESWNHHYNDLEEPRWPANDAKYDDPGLTIFDKWHDMIDNAVFDDDLPGGVRARDSTLIHVFDGPISKLLLNYDYLNGENKNELINQVLKEAIIALEEEYETSDIDKWLKYVETTWFDGIGILPPTVMHEMNRGTYNQIAEMRRNRRWWWCYPSRKGPRAMNVIPPGQSGFINGYYEISPHAYDQLALYETWTYKPMRYQIWDIWRVRESVKYLRY